MSLYRELWSRIGGRPWTYILRDIYHEAEWLVFGVSFFLGAFTYVVVLPWLLTLSTWAQLGFIFGVLTLGYVGGHLGWGRGWIKGQQGSPPVTRGEHSP